MDTAKVRSIEDMTRNILTLISKLALCVHPELEYCKVKDNKTDKVFIMMEARLVELFKKPEDYTVLEKMKGVSLKGLSYTPLFPM